MTTHPNGGVHEWSGVVVGPPGWRIGAVLLVVKRRLVQVGIVVLVLVLAVAVNVGWRWWHNRPPYGPEVLAASATLQFASYQEASAALRPVNAPWPDAGDQLMLGRVSWRPPPHPQKRGVFWIVVLDKRSHLKANVLAVRSWREDAVGLGSDGGLKRAVDRYPWLQGAAGHEVNGSWWVDGNCVMVSASDAAPVVFAVLFPAAARVVRRREQAMPTAPVALADLLIALVNIGPDGQVYWAQRLRG